MTAHIDEYAPRHQEFNIDRKEWNIVAFGEGKHQCPAMNGSLSWLAELTFRLAQYNVKVTPTNEPDCYFSPLLRDGKIMMNLFNENS